MHLATVIAAVRGALGDESDRLLLAGAFALNAHGLGRATADLDLTVPHAQQQAVIRAMEGLGFETLHVSEGFSNHLHPDATWGRVDFIYVDERTSRMLRAAATPTEVDGAPIAVPSPVHLIAMKVQAIKNDRSRRLKDLADIRFLLDLPGVDRQKARDYFERAGLLREWDELER